MKKIKFLLLISIILNFFYINPSFSKSFVLKITDDNGMCASAFLTNDKKIVTASHVLFNCKNLKIIIAEKTIVNVDVFFVDLYPENVY